MKSMKGFYLYCIRPCTSPPAGGSVRGKEKTDFKFSGEGMGGGKIFIVPYQDLAGIVSEVDLVEFNSEEIQRKAKEDLGWIKGKALIHQNVIGEAMELKFPPFPLGEDPLGNKELKVVIPMKFGTIFKTREKLKKTLKEHYSQFKENLENLTGKQEWTVKVYLNRKVFDEEVKKVSPVVQEKEKEIAAMPEGMAYFMQKQIDAAVSKEADNVLQKYGETFFETLKQHAVAGTKGKILEKELTGKSLPMVLNAIFLVSEKNLKDFVREINNLNKEFKNKGFTFEYSGPWPPYNFI